MSGISEEFVNWYFSDLTRTIAHQCPIDGWEWKPEPELSSDIKTRSERIHAEIESFMKVYREWAALTRSHRDDQQIMISAIQKREAGRESLIKVVRAELA
jgi:hypothetical protein